MITVDRITVEETSLFRQLRLSALEDAPAAFASTLEAELAYEDAEWERRALAASNGPEAAVFFARDAHRTVVGMVGAFQNRRDADTAELVSMWVAPARRGHGVGAALVERAVDWATESSYKRVELWVMRGNGKAERLYRRLGFEVTGDSKALPSDPCKDEIRMRRALV